MNFIKKFIFKMVIKSVLKNEGVNKTMNGIKKALEGKKTYLLAISALIGIVLSWLSGSIDNMEALKAIVEALFAVTIRAGVAKV